MSSQHSRIAPLRFPHILALYIGSVLGCGILILPGIAADMAGPASLVSWMIMIALVLPMSLTMGMLSVAYPSDGGVSYFVTRAFNPQIGSLVGWFFLLSVVIGVPILSLTGAGYIVAALGWADTWRVGIAAGIMLTGLILNYIGMRLSGQIQIGVVITTVLILFGAFIGSVTKIETDLFFPFMPHGLAGVGQATTLVFWCFIGWEAVSHIAEEFEDPERDVIRATLLAAVIISCLYLLTAIAVVGTASYGNGLSEISLIHLIHNAFGGYGVLLGGIAALCICIAPAIAYIGAAARLACSLSCSGYAPRALARLSPVFGTPVGGLWFLTIWFLLILGLFSTGLLSLATMIQIPNATFILTYLGGCAAGIILLKDHTYAVFVSTISCILSGIIFLFVSWAALYPIGITAVWLLYLVWSGKHTGLFRRGVSDPISDTDMTTRNVKKIGYQSQLKEKR